MLHHSDLSLRTLAKTGLMVVVSAFLLFIGGLLASPSPDESTDETGQVLFNLVIDTVCLIRSALLLRSALRRTLRAREVGLCLGRTLPTPPLPPRCPCPAARGPRPGSTRTVRRSHGSRRRPVHQHGAGRDVRSTLGGTTARPRCTSRSGHLLRPRGSDRARCRLGSDLGAFAVRGGAAARLRRRPGGQELPAWMAGHPAVEAGEEGTPAMVRPAADDRARPAGVTRWSGFRPAGEVLPPGDPPPSPGSRLRPR